MHCILCAHEASHPTVKLADRGLMFLNHHAVHDMLSICHV